MVRAVEAPFFALDKTIISTAASLALSRPMYRAGMVTRGQLLRGAYAQLVYALVGADEKKMDRLKEGMLALTKGGDRTERGRYTGELEFYGAGEAKAQAIRDLAERVGLDLEGSYAYSDSISDLPMLEAVGHPVAVNPDKDLRKEAEAREWDIRDFRRPVRLRTRIAQAAIRPESLTARGAATPAPPAPGGMLRARGHSRRSRAKCRERMFAAPFALVRSPSWSRWGSGPGGRAVVLEVHAVGAHEGPAPDAPPAA